MEQNKRNELVCAEVYRQFRISNRKKHIPLFCLYVFLCAAVLFCLVRYFSVREDPIRNFEKLNLPPDASVFLDTKGEFSDVGWSHYTVEKVIRCEQGLDYVRNYMLENNKASDLYGVRVGPFDTLSVMDIYNYDKLDDETARAVRADGLDKYIHIEYWYLGGRPNQWDLIKSDAP
ncbi:MAG: hypothetical protein J5841_02050 [Clostridia bacterium]|nr:hypothetical protein [Clostridia bacterium]